MKKRISKVVSSLLVFVILFTTFFGNIEAKAATASVLAWSDQDVVTLGGMYLGGHMMFLATNDNAGTDKSIAASGLPDNNYMNNNVTLYCLQNAKDVPGIGASFDTSIRLEKTGYFTDNTLDKIDIVLKYGYPANKDYWYDRGITSYAVQREITQYAIWYITSNRDGWLDLGGSGNVIPVYSSEDYYRFPTEKGADDYLVERCSGAADNAGGYTINDKYNGNGAAQAMLHEMMHMVKYNERGITGADAQCTVTALTSKAEYSDGKYNYYFKVAGANMDTDAGAGLRLTGIDGIPEGSLVSVAVADAVGVTDFRNANYTAVSGGTASLAEGVKSATKLVRLQTETYGLALTLKAEVPRRDGFQSYFFAPSDDNLQRFIQTVIRYKGDKGTAEVGAPDVSYADIVLEKYDDAGNALQGITFKLYDSSKTEISTATTNASGRAPFNNLDFGVQYYVAETDNGAYSNTAKFTIAGNVVTKNLGELVPVSFDRASHRMNIDGVNLDMSLESNNRDWVFDGLKVVNDVPALKLALTKISRDDNSPISDIEFKLMDASGAVVETAKTSAEGTLSFTKMKWDTEYQLAETENGNYKNKVDIVVGDNAAVSTTLGKGIKVKFDFATQTVTFGNTTMPVKRNANDGEATLSEDVVYFNESEASLSIIKVDADNSTKLIPNAVFTLYSDEACKNAVETVITDVNGKAEIKNLKVNTKYYLVETSVPEPYLLDKSVRVIDTSKGSGTAENKVYKFTVSVPNKESKGQITVEKTGNVLVGFDATNSKFIYEDRKVSGITFGVYSDEDCTNLVEILTTGADGTATTSELELGKYYVKELTTDKKTSLIINPTAELVNLEFDGQSEIVKSTVQVYDKHQEVELNVVKLDRETEKAIEGAEFTLSNKEDICDYLGNVIVKANTPLMTSLSDANGNIYFKDIPNGGYVATETAVAEGYVEEHKSVAFDCPFADATKEKISLTSKVTNTKQKGYIRVFKTGNVLTGYEKEKFIFEDKLVGGAKFGIYSDEKCTNLLEELTTVDGTFVTSKEYGLGNYYVKEIQANTDNVLNTKVTLVTLAYDRDAKTVYTDCSPVNKKQNVTISLIKIDKETEKAIEGAKFTLYADEDIYDYTGKNLLANKGVALSTCLSDKDGNVAFDIDLPCRKFKVVETEAAPGYILPELEARTFKYDMSWSVETQDQEALINKSVVFPNAQSKIQIAKKDSTGIQGQLVGATISLRDVNDPSKIIYQFVTSDKPEDISMIPTGTYILREDEAPWGFELAEDQIIEIVDTEDVQYFEIVDEALLGTISFQYDNSGDWLRMPEVAADIPSTGDAAPVTMYLFVMAVAMVSFVACLNRKRFAKRVKGIIGLSALVAVLTFPALGVNAAELDTVTETKSYTSSDENKKYDFEDEIVKNGTEYELTDVTYRADKKETTKNVIKTQISDSEIFYLGESEDGLFENNITVDGEQYMLKDVKKIAIDSITNRSENHNEAVQYVGYTSLEPQQTMSVNAYDPLLKKTTTSTLKLQDTKITKTYWSDDFNFTIKVNVTGPYFLVNGNVESYNEETPGLEKYNDYFLSSMNLDNTMYKINSLSWDGDLYEENGTTYRNVAVKGSRLLNDYELIYGGSVEFEDINNAYKYEATYVKNATELTGEYEYDIVATATYTEKEFVSDIGVIDIDNSKKDSTFAKTLLIGLTVVVVIALILIFIFFLLRRRKTQQATTYTKDDDRSTF